MSRMTRKSALTHTSMKSRLFEVTSYYIAPQMPDRCIENDSQCHIESSVNDVDVTPEFVILHHRCI